MQPKVQVGDRVTVHPKHDWPVEFRRNIGGKPATVRDVTTRVATGETLAMVELDRPSGAPEAPRKLWWFEGSELAKIKLVLAPVVP